MRRLALIAAVILASACGAGKTSLAIGAPAPDFSLPGADGKTHTLAEYAASRVLALVVTCNHCPASQMYEARLAALHRDYRNKGVAIVAINPYGERSLRLDELSHTDLGESLDDMKARAEFRQLEYPYLSDGQTQALTKALGAVVTPQIFVFDQARTLRYQGRIDDSARGDRVTSTDARKAIDALVAGSTVATAETTAAGCPVTLPLEPARRDAEDAAIAKEQVAVEAADRDAMTRLRKNGTGKLVMINFWATWCAPCVSEFPDLEATYRMYRARGLDFVTVSVNDPEERPAVMEFLQEQHASHRNLQFATADVYGLQAAFDPAMPAPVPFTLVLAPNGDVLHQELGASDVPKLRRAILASLPDDKLSIGQQAYWSQK